MLHPIWALAAMAMQPGASIEHLEWLEGHWRAEDTRMHNQGRFTEEHWMEATAGAMFGINRTVRDGKTTGFEYMRIVEAGGGLVFIAQPGGDAPARFPMVAHARNEIVFANPAHDYPQRIVYRREGNVLTGTISLADGSRPISWTFRLKRQR